MSNSKMRAVLVRGSCILALLLGSTTAMAQTVVFDDFEHGDPIFVGWFAFGSATGGGGIDPNGADLAPIPGNMVGMQTGWGSGAGPGFWGGFGWQNPIDIAGTDTFTMWINPDAGQDYFLEINIQDDDNGDGAISPPDDDEFQFNCRISPTGPCAIAGGGWQKIEIPLSDFFDDNSFLTGGNGVLDAVSTANGGNGELIVMVAAVVSNLSVDVTFRTDQWQFENSTDTDGDGINNNVDNCILIANPAQQDSNGDGFGNICDQDVDNNCVVTFLDFGQIAQPGVLFSNPASPGWNADLDFDSNNIINFLDVGKFPGSIFGPPGPSALASCDP